jgi:PPOX class probable F420-dependent enzyme
VFDDSDFGRRARRRFEQDTIAWLVTAGRDGTPQPAPVWFLWRDDGVLIYSQPDAPKLRNIARMPRVAVHLDGDGTGGDIVVLTGTARVASEVGGADGVPEYVGKYATGIEELGWSPAEFAADYSVPILVTPRRLRGH